jgi:type IV pilus assembly protein PilE
MTAFSYTINQANVRSSTVSGLSGWTGNATCWVTKKGGVC